MAFAYEIESITPLSPSRKRLPKSGQLYLVTGTYTNGGGDTGGAIPTGFNEVLHAHASSSTGLLGLQIALSGGTITLTTTADYDGTFMAICK